ncbi:MAG: hypothetical protein JWL62_2416 [Hyphomicrobiales bacterium]|nr:hypothetical protein [Hyphomicrobiales bacterium]
MICDTSSTGRFALFGAAAFALALGVSAPRPALALDDDGSKNVFSAVLGLVGISGEKEDPSIDYRERAPLVVPPNRSSLPQPLPPVANRNAAWPKDQEIVRRKQAEEAARRPRVDEVQNPVSREELARGRSASGAATAPPQDAGCSDPLSRVCNPETFWSGLRNARSSSDEVKLAPGKEPSRDWLTEPPAGFRKATKETKYVGEKARDEIDITDPRAQLMEERRRKTE